MKKCSLVLSVCFGLSLFGCHGGAASGSDQARQTAAELKGDTATAAADNTVCRMFTPADLAQYISEPLGAGTNAAMATGCQWPAVNSDGFVQLQIVTADLHVQPSVAPGYHPLPDVGSKGYVVPAHEGWDAAAITGSKSVQVSVAGARATEAATVALLQAALARAAH